MKQKKCNNECGTSFCCNYIQQWEEKADEEYFEEQNELRGNYLLNTDEKLIEKFPVLKEWNIRLVLNPCKFLTDKGCCNENKPVKLCKEYPDKEVWKKAECPLVLPKKCKFAKEADIWI